ncbi:hypothetical protein L6164_012698 [Bauhinia variegata]|uniref:Uncharacterized protein n=1 Tax=Bauhinia variegata TaxID=167791 RepID=A0ACB9PAT5_BAUVA|nr:hypothetical protein L6164_012698 [Bauhinia variegata]
MIMQFEKPLYHFVGAICRIATKILEDSRQRLQRHMSVSSNWREGGDGKTSTRTSQPIDWLLEKGGGGEKKVIMRTNFFNRLSNYFLVKSFIFFLTLYFE